MSRRDAHAIRRLRSRRQPGRRVLARHACAWAVMAALPAHADDDTDFAVFRLTDWDGAITLSRLDDRSTVRLGGGESSIADSRTALKVSLNGRGFVYHENLFAIDAGVGLAAQSSRFTVEAGAGSSDTRDTRSLYDLSLHVGILRDKPYNGQLYYEHLNPTVTVGPAIVMLQENTRYGGRFAWQAPATPVPLTVEGDRLRSKGTGSDRIVDDRTDRFVVGAEAPILRMGHARLRIDGSRLDSRSGIVGLPISRTVSDTATQGLDTRMQWGDDGRYQLTGLLTRSTQRYSLGDRTPADRRDWRGNVDLRARHEEGLLSYLSLDGSQVDQGELHNRAIRPRAGLSWWRGETVTAAVELRGEAVDTAQLTSRSHGGSLAFEVRAPLAGGRAQAGYATSYDIRSQTASAGSTSVIGERHVLPGIAIVALDRPNVTPGSVAVANEARTQVYVEGRDYLLSVLGVQTRLQRIVGGAIGDGEAVLVDYAVQTGGSFDSTLLDLSLSASWSWANRFTVYARRVESTPTVTSGAPLFVLNSVRSTAMGLQATMPVGTLWTVGGNLEREDRSETILSSRRTTGDLFAQWEEAFLGPGSIRAGVRRQRVRYDLPAQDVDIAGYEFRYHVLTPTGVDLQADWNTEADRGGLIERRRDLGTMQARWRFRQLLMTLAATHVRESQGDLRNTRTIAQLMLRREF